MIDKIYSVDSGMQLVFGYQYDHKSTKIKFSGFSKQDPSNLVYLKIEQKENKYLIPLFNFEWLVTQPITNVSGTIACQLVEVSTDNEFVSNSRTFNAVVMKSIEANKEYEVHDPNLDLWTTQIKNLYDRIISGLETGEFKGEKGDPGEPGADGYTPKKGIDYFDGEKGDTGPVGPSGEPGCKGDPFRYEDFTADQLASLKGEKGDAGYTPVKGVDYFDGAKGEKGDPGEVTYIENPYDDTDIKSDLSELDSEVDNLAKVGWYLPNGLHNYVEDGVLHQKVGRVDLGSLTWTATSVEKVFQSRISDIKRELLGTILCGNYTVSDITSLSSMVDMSIVKHNDNIIRLKDNRYDESTIKSNLTGVYLYYELAEEITKTVGEESVASSMAKNLDVKITKPTESATVGKVLKVKSVNDDGTFVCEWADESGGSDLDVQINGTSIVSDGVANIPVGSTNVLGVAKYKEAFGIGINSENQLYVKRATWSDIDEKTTHYRPIVPYTLPYAVKSAMSSTTDADWTSTEQASARERLGIVSAEGVYF